jgi:hypothetical protein
VGVGVAAIANNWWDHGHDYWGGGGYWGLAAIIMSTSTIFTIM